MILPGLLALSLLESLLLVNVMSLPQTVQAITFSKHGGLEVLEKTTLPFPEQKPGDVIVKVRESYT